MPRQHADRRAVPDGGPGPSTAPAVPALGGDCRADAWSAAREILCVRLDQIGDVLMTGPAMRALAAGGRRITLLCGRGGAAVARLMPEVSDTILYAAPWMKAGAAEATSATDRALIVELRERRFDAAVVFTVATQSPLPAALMLALAEVPLRLAHCRENPYALLTDWVREPEGPVATRHEVRRQLDLVAAVGARVEDDRLRLVVPEDSRARVTRRLADALPGERSGGRSAGSAGRWAVVHPGSSAPSRRYPPEMFASACRALAADHGVGLVFSGDASEVELVESVRAAVDVPTVSFAGELSLPELVALLATAPLLISGNTGPVHLAAAVGTPVLDVYALTNPQHTPWGVPNVTLVHDVPCRWCLKSVCPEGHHLCLRGIPPGEIVAAALSLLEAPDRSPGEPWRSALAVGLPAAG